VTRHNPPGDITAFVSALAASADEAGRAVAQKTESALMSPADGVSYETMLPGA